MPVLKVYRGVASDGKQVFDFYLNASSVKCIDRWKVADATNPQAIYAIDSSSKDGSKLLHEWHPFLEDEFDALDGCYDPEDVIISDFVFGDTANLIQINMYTPPDNDCPETTYVISKIAYLMSEQDGKTIDTIR